VEVDYRVVESTPDLVFGLAIANANGLVCWGSNTHIDRAELGPLPERGTLRLAIERLDMVQGTYFVDAAAHATDGRAYDYIKRAASFAVRSSVGDEGVFRPPHRWELAGREEG
jgi:hypothetical protein